MGDEHDRVADRAPQRNEVVIELEARDLVERRERLIHQQQGRVGDEPARDRNPHLHAAGEFARIGVAKLGEADLLQRPDDALSRDIGRDAGERERQRDIVRHRAPRHQGRLLEHEADRKPVAPRARPGPAPRNGAARRLAEPCDQPQRRRLAAAGRPEYRDEFAARDREVEAVERPDAPGEMFGDALEDDDRLIGVAWGGRRCGHRGHLQFRRNSRPTFLLTKRSV
jgi:hypothetical protein